MKRAASILLMALFVAGCGDDSNGNGDDPAANYPELADADPLDLATIDRGVGIRHGSPQALSYLGSSYAQAVQTMPHAVMHVQAYDEAAQNFGGYRTYPWHDQPSPRPPTDFTGQNVSSGEFAPRVADLVEETADAASNAGTDNFSSFSVVLDLYRIRGDWYVRWDGKLDTDANTVGKSAYGFYREDMTASLLDQIEEVAGDQKPRYFIIGTEMERLVRRDDADGLSQQEWSNFVLFFQQAVERVKSASSETKVGAGINWDRFVERVAPLYAMEDDIPLQALDRAFETLLLPLAKHGDVVTLSSYRQPGQEPIELAGGELTPTQAYQFLRRLEPLYGLTKPVVWYSIGSPIQSSVSDQNQRTYLEQFLAWNSGVNVEYVAWKSAVNYDGADTAGQMISGRCEALVQGNNNNFDMPKEHCFDGLFDSVFQGKAPFDFIAESLE